MTTMTRKKTSVSLLEENSLFICIFYNHISSVASYFHFGVKHLNTRRRFHAVLEREK